MLPRVLVITTYYYPVVGGVETHSRQLVAYLTNAGFEVQVVTKRVSASDPREDLVDGVRVHRVGPAGDRHGSGKWIALPFVFRKILALRKGFDVVVCVDYRGVGISAISAGRLLHVPVIVQSGTAGVLAPPSPGVSTRGASTTGVSTPRSSITRSSVSGVPLEGALVRLLKSPARFVYRHADHFVCIGHDIEQEALDAGIPRQRVHYLPHGVDLERFHPATAAESRAIRTANGWPIDRRLVLFVGRLSVEKGIVDLVEAWRLLDAACALLVVVGPDMPAHPWDAGPRVRALIETNDLGNRILLHGPATDTAPFYRAADIFVQPSHFEGFGISAIEAMASGVPVVASRVGGLRDFLVDGDNALLHEPRSPVSIAGALTRLLGDETERSKLAQAGLRTVRDRFDENVLLARYAELIRRATGAPAGTEWGSRGPTSDGEGGAAGA